MKTKPGTRKVYLDVLRILAAFLVVFNHTEGYHLYLEQMPDGSLGSWLRVILSVFTKVNIPLFFMVSGALLLGREESYASLLRKRVLRMAGVLVVFSALIYTLRDGGNIFSGGFVRDLFAGKVTLSYWFLFAYLGFLLSLPFLRKIAGSMTWEDFWFLVILQLVMCSLIPLYQYISKACGIAPVVIRGDFQIPFSTMHFLFYPLVGAWLSSDRGEMCVGKWPSVRLMGVLVLGLGMSSCVTYHQGMTAGFTQDYVSLFLAPCAISVFVLVRRAIARIPMPGWLERWISVFSGLTFGVYLLEPLLNHYLYYAYGGGVDRMLFSILWCGFSMIVCAAATWVLKKIPVIGKLL